MTYKHPRTAIYINELDLRRLGFITESVEGWLDSPSVLDRTTQLPGRVGAIILAPETETSPRTVTVNGLIKLGSSSAVRAAIDKLKNQISRGTLEVRFVDHLDRIIYARAQETQLVATQPQFTSPFSRVALRFFCPDPLIYAKQGTLIGLITTATPIPLGTAVSAPTLRIMGPATNPVLTYRKADGTATQSMGFTITLAGTDYLEINCEVDTIKKVISGVETIDLNLLTSGHFISLDPQDGDPDAQSFPSLELSAGTGEVMYRKAWL